MAKHPQCTGEYYLPDGTYWQWSVTYFDDEDDGGLTGYRVEVDFEHGAVQVHGETLVMAEEEDPLTLAAPQVFAATGDPVLFRITLPPVVGEGLARAIARVHEIVGMT